jgi:iron-sulfur cluster assembly accessory protein
MGTFHDTRDPLHGITVVARCGRSVYVGRCHERDAESILLLGVDSHEEDQTGKGDDGLTNTEFLDRAARFGVWGTHERVSLATGDVEGLIPLNEYYRGAEALTQPAPDPVAQEAREPVSADKPVQLTDSAIREVGRLLDEEGNQGKGLRLGVSGGGCSGLVYKVEFDSRDEGDLVVPYDGFEVFMDRKSTIYLRGITLDYQQGLTGKGFQFHNPNASNTCGCGESFSV